MDDERRELVRIGGIMGIVLGVTDPPNMELRITRAYTSESSDTN